MLNRRTAPLPLAILLLITTGGLARADSESDALQAQINQRNAQAAQISSQLTGARNQEASLQAQQVTLASQLTTAQSTAALAQAKFNATQSGFDSVQASRQVLNQQWSDLHAQSIIDQAELSNLTASRTAGEQKLYSLQQQTTAAQSQLSDLHTKALLQTAQLSQLNAASSLLNGEVVHANEVISHAPKNVQRLLVQTGTLRGSGRICSAFEISAGQIRTARHCVAGIELDELNTWSFYDGQGHRRNVAGIANTDWFHDAITLDLAGSDDLYTDLAATPSMALPVRLLAYDHVTTAVTVSPECQILSLNILSGDIHYDCESQAGSSGGALVQNGLIVGVHLGRFGNSKIATVINTENKRWMDFAVLNGLTPEYNCSSDCRASATHNISYPCPTFRNPRRSCSKGVFEPVEFSACESGRTASCSADAAAADLSRLKSSLRAETDRIGHTISSLSDDLIATNARVTETSAVVNGLSNSLVQVQATASSLTAQTTNLAHLSAQYAVDVTGATQAIEAIKLAAKVTVQEKAALVVTLSDISEKTKLVSNGLQTAVAQAASVGSDIAKSSAEIAALNTKDLSVKQIVAASKAVVAVSESIKAPLSIVSKPVEDVGTFLGDEFTKSKSGIASLKASPNLIVSNLSTNLLKKITDTHNKYTDSLRALLRPFSGHAKRPAYIIEDPANLLRNNVCAARSLARLNQYVADTKSMGIVDWPSKIAEIQLDALAGAEQLLTKNAIALAAAQIEIKSNGCDNIGLDQVIGESLLDASEWLAWVKEVRENLASNAAK